jgi:hypothetical protein
VHVRRVQVSLPGREEALHLPGCESCREEWTGREALQGLSQEMLRASWGLVGWRRWQKGERGACVDRTWLATPGFVGRKSLMVGFLRSPGQWALLSFSQVLLVVSKYKTIGIPNLPQKHKPHKRIYQKNTL